jgi:hypothetical protein
MIKQTLMKVIDDMNKMEGQRLLPDGHPKKMSAMPPAPEAPAIAADEPDAEEGGDLDPGMLGQLLDKAGQANPDGSTEEDAQVGLDPDIAAIVAEKKKKPTVKRRLKCPLIIQSIRF